MTPSIILVRPQMGENIGAAARAMANFGLSDLRLVAPRDGWPNPKASDTAGKALSLLDDARVFAKAEEAVADCHYVLATTARARAVNMPVLEADAAMQEVRARIVRGEKCGILFGAERTGLENEEVALADAVLTIPVSETYPSLNLSQAVVVVAYEWFIGSAEAVPFIRNAAMASTAQVPATKEEILGLFNHLEQVLDEVNFWRVAEKKEGMWRNIRATLMRAGLSSQEVATWRGIIRAMSQKVHKS